MPFAEAAASRECPSSSRAIAKSRRTHPPSPVFAATPRRSLAECSSRVSSMGWPMTGPPVPVVEARTESNNQRFGKGPRVRHYERWYKTAPREGDPQRRRTDTAVGDSDGQGPYRADGIE